MNMLNRGESWEQFNRIKPTVHFIKLLFLLAILLWISSFFSHRIPIGVT